VIIGYGMMCRYVYLQVVMLMNTQSVPSVTRRRSGANSVHSGKQRYLSLKVELMNCSICLPLTRSIVSRDG
jgi:hypothetical protein